MSAVIEQRRAFTAKRLEEFKTILAAEAESTIGDKACVYVTGSGGRGEMSPHSDLDLFIVSDVEVPREKRPPSEMAKSKLSKLDAIVVKAHLIRAARASRPRFEEFSKDGKYLEMHTFEELCENLGKPEDDHANTFTARLLLLLESRPLLGTNTYQRIISEVIAPYWEDYEDHQDRFRPVFLINDILRMWKTFCVNYEAFTKRQPEEKRAKRKLTNYKLKNSRVLTCYSAIFHLMQIFADKRTVNPDDVQAMVKMSPTERLQWIARQSGFTHGGIVSRLLESYERFLESTNRNERELVEIFMDHDRAKDFVRDAHQVGDTIAELLQKMGSGNELYRYLIV